MGKVLMMKDTGDLHRLTRGKYVSLATRLGRRTVQVVISFKKHKSTEVIVKFSEKQIEAFKDIVACAELMVMKEILAHDSPTKKNKTTFQTNANLPTSISLTSDLAMKALSRSLVKDYTTLGGFERFGYMWLQYSIFITGNDRKTLLRSLGQRFDRKKTEDENAQAYFINANADFTPTIYSSILGKVHITEHAYEKMVSLSRFAYHNFTPESAFSTLILELSEKSKLIRVELSGKVREDKMFYAEDAEYWGKSNRNVRYTIVPSKKGDGVSLVTVYQRPQHVGQDPNEVNIGQETEFKIA